MLNPGFSDALAASGFVHRASFQGDGTIVYRLSNGSGHVLVQGAEWHRLGRDFKSRMAPVRRRTRKLCIGLPPATFLFGMTLAQLLPFGGAMILGAIFLGPLAICLWHSRQVQRISRAIEEELANLPRSEAVERDPRREPRWFEIAFMVLVGPHLLVSIVGEMGGPDFFRGTPFRGAGVGMAEIVAILLIALRMIWPRIGPRLARAR
jgi:hypothetical protein